MILHKRNLNILTMVSDNREINLHLEVKKIGLHFVTCLPISDSILKRLAWSNNIFEASENWFPLIIFASNIVTLLTGIKPLFCKSNHSKISAAIALSNASTN